MGIQSAMYSGVSGLNTNSQAMNVIGNNLANTNTIGFKGSRTVFSDLLSSSVFGSGGTSQVGRGVGLSTVDNIFSQGTFETTTLDTDVAIEGEGFFIVSELSNDTMYYTRAGSFRFDEEGYMVNPEGYVVQGKGFDENGELLPADPGNIRVEDVGLIEANATSELTFTTNLDAASEQLGGAAADIDPDNVDSYNYSATSTIFDSLGKDHLVTVYWRLVDATTNTWASGYTLDADAASFTALPNMVFDPDGNLPAKVVNNVVIADWGNGSAVNQPLAITFDCTQYDSESVVIGEDQNGYASGELTNVGIGDAGIVIATYSNGEAVYIAQLVLAKFQNPGGLNLVGSNQYEYTEDAGQIRIGLAGPELGRIYSNSLEQSNVDMGQEFVKMIATQRGFQANSKIISTIDEMLGELINLKR
ncbi:MAG: flagellar hook-basal body protein [Desulfobulbus propionicus]|nr:MAG: flagellar hook-basal body protein [Desulfobulbus propionicus]